MPIAGCPSPKLNLNRIPAWQPSRGGPAECTGRDGSDDLAVFVKEGNPALAIVVGRRPAAEIAGDGALGDVETKLEELAVDARGASDVIGDARRAGTQTDGRRQSSPA
jgi:hypothetical protein